MPFPRATVGSNVTVFDDYGISPTGTYYYRIRAMYPQQGYATGPYINYSGAAYSLRVDPISKNSAPHVKSPVIQTPKLSGAFNYSWDGNPRILLSWNSVKDSYPDGTKIYIYKTGGNSNTAPNFGNVLRIAIIPVKDAQYIDKSFSWNTTYGYQIVAVSPDNVRSPVSNGITIKVPIK